MVAPHNPSQSPPAPDGPYAAIDRLLAGFGYERTALLEALHAGQDAYGYLPRELLEFVARRLSLPLSEVYGVATFYDMFTLAPVGETHCLVCTDPACAIAGAEDLLDAITAEIEAGGPYSVKRGACLGLCDQAPAALSNGVAQVELSPADVPALLRGEATTARLNVTGEPRVLTARIGAAPPTDLAAQRALGAFAALGKALGEMTAEQVIEEVKASGLTGRGGAGFPTGLKWQFTRQAADPVKYVVCNFDESEPGTFKDRALVEGDPFRVLEGLVLAGYATGAQTGYVFVRGEYRAAAGVLREAVAAMRAANLLGDDVLGSGFAFDIQIRRGAGAYICGEETALFEAIDGRRGHPRSKPPYPTTEGLFGRPTSINNVETLAIVPELVLNGGAWLRQWGTEKSIGLKLFCLSGHVRQPGVVEAPFGLTVRELIEQYGGGFDGEPQAVLMGGAAGGFLHPDHLDTPLTHETLNPLNAPVGSGVVMVFNQTVDLWEVVAGLARFFVHETCGRCVPCRVGTMQIYRTLERVLDGERSPAELEALAKLGREIKQTVVCGLGMTAANPLLTVLDNFEMPGERR